MTKEKRPILKIGLMINFIVFIFYLLSLLLGLILYLIYEDKLGLFFQDIGIINFFKIIIIIGGTVITGISLKLCKKSFEEFRQRQGFVLTSVILIVILIILELLSYISQDAAPLLFIILWIIGSTLSIIGYIKAFKPAQSNFESNPDDIYNKIEKLYELKESNVISEEEFQVLKSKQLNK